MQGLPFVGLGIVLLVQAVGQVVGGAAGTRRRGGLPAARAAKEVLDAGGAES